MAKRSQRQAVARQTSNAHAEVRALFPRESANEMFEEAGRDQSYIRKIRPQSDNQRRLMEAIDQHNLVMALGPAGTGKTYLAIAKAVEALESGRIERIVLSRPAVEAGESLGYLPGDLEEKLAPYLRPL